MARAWQTTSARPPTQFAVYNALRCPKTHLLYPDFGHEAIQAFDDALLGFFGKGAR